MDKFILTPEVSKEIMKFIEVFPNETTELWQENDGEKLVTKAKIISDNKSGKDVVLVLCK